MEDIGINSARWIDSKRLTVHRNFADGRRAIWQVAIDGSQAGEILPPTTTLTPGEAFPVSPDGKKIVYSATVGDYAQLFTLDLETHAIRQLTVSGEGFPVGQ